MITKLYVAANLVELTRGFGNFGHLQIVAEYDVGDRNEIEVQSPSSGGNWLVFGDGTREHETQDNTVGWDNDQVYKKIELDLGGRDPGDVWETFKQAAADIDNSLFWRDNTMMLFGDAKKMTEEVNKGM